MTKPTNLKQIAKFVLAGSAVIFVASMFLRNRLPDKSRLLPELLQDPVQTDADLPGPFDVTRKNVTYTVTPMFNYELWGMIVSYHHASSFMDISHEQWKDFVNVKDLCVIWGKNASTGVYGKMRFKNRDFTCFYTYPDEATGKVFSENCLSNNHILPADPIVSGTVMRARKGDQIHLKGYLCSYGIKDSPYKRMTSTTRTDRGNGACETVFVSEFDILRAANGDWHMLNKVSLVLMVVCLGYLVFGGGAPRREV